jgi:hypothetical protein
VATPNSAGTLVLNEININPPGADNEKEFIELISPNGGSMSTNGYSILLIDVDGTNTGTVLEMWSLDAMSTGTNGLLLIGANYTAPGGIPWTGASAPEAATHFGFPAGMGFDDIGGTTSNGATLIILAKDFAGRVGDDLDAGTGEPPTGADNGVFDTLPANQRVDSAGVRFWDASAIPPALVGRVYTGTADLSRTGYTPDNLSRIRGNYTPHTVANWYGGDISGTAGTSTDYDAAQKFPTDFAGRVTPGQANVQLIDDTSDVDFDTANNLLEEAFAMNPNSPDANKLPDGLLVDEGGVPHPAIQFRRLKTPGTISYAVEVSHDLIVWAGGSEAIQYSVTDNGDGVSDTVVFRVNSTHLADPPIFMRVRVSRQ